MLAGTTSRRLFLPVSAMTGQGLDRLRARLETAAGSLREPGNTFSPGRRSRLHPCGLRRCGDGDSSLRVGSDRRPGADQPFRPHGAGAIVQRRVRRLRSRAQPTVGVRLRVRTSRRRRLGAAMSCSTPNCTRRRTASTPSSGSCQERKPNRPVVSGPPPSRSLGGRRAIVLLEDRPIAPGDEAEVQLALDRPIAAAVMDRYNPRHVGAADAGRRRLPQQ